jgi:hypothetical protein
MKKLVTIWMVICLAFGADAQKVQTIVPKQPVVTGTAFQVQYIITQPTDLLNITAPGFEGFRVVSGPNHYKGEAIINGKLQPIENITYTLVSLDLGEKEIKGIRVSYKNAPEEESNAANIMLIPQPRVSFSARSSYTDVSLYAPSSKADLEKMIADNLFINAEVSRRICYVGEPVLATFRLYSRLQSASELTRAPALYGFSIMDVITINESHQEVEMIGGKVFNTSTLRKVQLYPEQPGKLVVDEMVLDNEIHFADSIHGGTTTIEKQLKSAPIVLTIKPLPANKPENFTGAVGRFSITSRLLQDSVSANHQGRLLVTISGKGNFIQFAPPAVHWPAGFDVFDPETTDHLNKSSVPVEGSRQYMFSFTMDQPGYYRLPGVEFAYFDAVTKKYTTTKSDTLSLVVTPVTKIPVQEKEQYYTPRNYLFLIITLVMVAVTAFLILHKRKTAKKKGGETPVSAAPFTLNTWSLSDKEACMEIQKLLGRYLQANSGLTTEERTEIRSIQSECQLLIYSEVAEEGKRKELEERAGRAMGKQ